MPCHRLVSPEASRAARLGLTTLLTTLLLAGCIPVPRQQQPTNVTATPTPAVATADPTGTPPMKSSTPAATAAATAAATPPTAPGQTPRATPSPNPSPNPPPDKNSLDNAAIEPGGVGPIRIGMSLSEAQANGWVARNELCQRWDASPELRDRGLSFTFVHDELYEIWVRGFEFATAEHIRVSDNMRKARAAYGTKLRTELRDGGGGRLRAWFVMEGEHELLFLEEDPGRDDTIKAILARTHGTPVVEGC